MTLLSWWWEGVWHTRYITGKILLDLAVSCMPNGMVKRELRQALWVWRSTIDMKLAVALNDENHGTELYPQVTYAEQLPERFRHGKKRRNNRR